VLVFLKTVAGLHGKVEEWKRRGAFEVSRPVTSSEIRRPRGGKAKESKHRMCSQDTVQAGTPEKGRTKPKLQW